MKKIKLYCSLFLSAIIASIFGGCASEEPFSTEGEGLVKMNVSMNSMTTRATVEGSEMQTLLDKCVIYISNDKGLLHKWVGVGNIPSQGVYLRYGSYVAEAWSGDSVAASFDKKFYKGMTLFDVSASQATTQVTIPCRIANVVVSIDEATIDSQYMTDLSVKFSSNDGELNFSDQKLMEKGYFMMSDNDNTINYELTAKNNLGEQFTKSGVIENVKSSHEYRLSFDYNPQQSTEGGAFIEIRVQEYSFLIDEEVWFYAKPVFSWVNNAVRENGQIIGNQNDFDSYSLRVSAYNGFSSLTVSTDNSIVSQALGFNSKDILNAEEQEISDLEQKGLSLQYNKVGNNIHEYTLTFGSEWLKSLEPSQTELILNVIAKDVGGKEATKEVRIANTPEAIVFADPINIDTDRLKSDLTAIRCYSAKIFYQLSDNTDFKPYIQYREKDAETWETMLINISGSGNSGEVILTNLKPSTNYECRGVAGEIIDGHYEFESDEIYNFKTEDIFTIPNYSMEYWHNDAKDNALIPMPEGESFWDTGNHGSITMRLNLTQSSSTCVSSGTTSACLKSQYVGLGGPLGKFAAGNMFAGSYDNTVGTNAELTFGRPFNGSHPKALKVMANYRPGKVEYLDGEAKNHLEKGKNDEGQIYVAIASSPSQIKTKDGQLFDANASNIIGFGEVTWNDNYGDEGQMKEVQIDITYNERAKTAEAKYIIIVCSASKYGDFFSGGNSTLYLDDFELVYE